MCGLTVQEASAITNQGYNNTRFFRNIYQDSLTKLFSDNVVLEYMKLTSKKNIISICVWLQYCSPNNIYLINFDNTMIETKWEVSLSKEEATYRPIITGKS